MKYSPNGGLMVIYHGRTLKKNTLSKQELSVFSSRHVHVTQAYCSLVLWVKGCHQIHVATSSFSRSTAELSD